MLYAAYGQLLNKSMRKSVLPEYESGSNWQVDGEFVLKFGKANRILVDIEEEKQC